MRAKIEAERDVPAQKEIEPHLKRRAHDAALFPVRAGGSPIVVVAAEEAHVRNPLEYVDLVSRADRGRENVRGDSRVARMSGPRDLELGVEHVGKSVRGV